ncbi:MAG: exonuclease [Gammaproteobacteria bacterium]|nr:MAG: exonuclease [Gammaproteobacteria bacterium]RKZ72259.1 MAG: exonuclease [Gammaproteobacteria bacterium]
MIVYDVEQRTREWHALRHGVVTASDAHKLQTTAKFNTFKYQILAQVLTDLPENIEDGFQNDAMLRGELLEPVAAKAYAEKTGLDVFGTGFCKSDETPYAGCSPDLIIGTKGLGEMKIPNTETHMRYMDGKIPPDIKAQMQFQMLVFEGEREWCDFISFDNRLKAKNMHLHVQRFERDDDVIAQFKEALAKLDDFIEDFIYSRA